MILLGVLLLTNLDKGFQNTEQDKLIVQARPHVTLEQIVLNFPEAEIESLDEQIVSVPYGKTEEYLKRFEADQGVQSVQLIPVQGSFQIKKYVYGFKERIQQYFQGDFGGLTYNSKPDREYPINAHLTSLITRSFTYLIPGILGGIVFGYALAVFAAWVPRLGRVLDRIHKLMLGVPDFFLIVLLQMGAILLAKAYGKTVVIVMQFVDDTPFLIPCLAVAITTGLFLYGAIRIAVEREWNAPYVKTAYSKGLTRTMVIFKHILRNVTADLIAILPRIVTIGITSLVIVEVMSGIFGLGGYATNPNLNRVSSLTTTCAILAGFALAAHLLIGLLRKRFLIKHEGGNVGGRSVPYTKKDNLLFQVSVTFVVILAFVTVFGSYLMTDSITAENRINFSTEIVNGKTEYVSPPFAPNEEFWLGTDHRGYDIFSLLLNGAKYTMFFGLAVAATRFLIALPLGLFVGLTGRGKGVLNTVQLITSAVPILIFLFPILYGLSRTMGLSGSLASGDPKIVLFGAILFGLLVFFGVFQLAHQFAQRADFYSGSLYISVAKTMGASNLRIMFRHLAPQLRPEILYAFLIEFVQVLFLIGQLAVLNIFLGGREQVVQGGNNTVYLPLAGEWSGMIAYGVEMFRYYPWILLSVGCFLTIFIMIILFFANQLEKRVESSHVNQNVWFRSKRVLSLAGTTALAAILVVTMLPNKAPQMDTATLQSQPTVATPTTSKPTTPKPQKDFTLLKNKTNEFMKYLVQGDWESAEAYIDPENTPVQQAPMKPFDRWIDAFTNLTYTYEGVGEITTINEQSGEYKIELKIKDAAGNPVSWYLMTEYYIQSGHGEPVE